jgi:WD40 repeat protein
VVWKTETGELQCRVKTVAEEVTALAFDPKGEIVATSGFDGEIVLCRLSDRAVVRTLLGHTNHVQSLAFLAGGDIVVSSGYDETIRFWDVKSGQSLQVLRPTQRPIGIVTAVGPDELNLASGTIERICHLWKLPKQFK